MVSLNLRTSFPGIVGGCLGEDTLEMHTSAQWRLRFMNLPVMGLCLQEKKNACFVHNHTLNSNSLCEKLLQF